MARPAQERSAPASVLALVLTLVLAPACLPADTRPPPSTIALTVDAPDPAPVTTADGWTVTIDRLIAGVGNATLEDGCIVFSAGRYDRLLDARLAGEQKLSTLYGLGTCNLRYRIAGPSIDTLLGEGVSAADKLAMGTPATDPWHSDPERASVDLAMTARRGNENAHIHWRWRQVIRYRNCGLPAGSDGGETRALEFPSNGTAAFHLELRAERLLSDDPRGGALRFDPIAAADNMFGNGDGEISLAELAGVPLTWVRSTVTGPYRFDGEGDGGLVDVDGGPGVRSLGDYLVWVLLPTVAQFREQLRCSIEPAGSPLDP